MTGSAVHLEGGAAFDASAGGAGTLPRSWARQFARAPERIALLDERGGELSYGALDAATRRGAGRLHRAGLRAGDRVLVSAVASLDLAVAHVACLRLGLVVVPANTAYRAAELAHLVGDARPRAAIRDDPARDDALRAADPRLRLLAPALDLPDAAAPPLDAAPPDSPALIGYTSGTTGRPKGAVLSHANLLASAESLRLAWRWTAADRLVLALPLFHMHGLGVGLHGTLHAGASAVLVPQFEVERVVRAIERFGATLFFGVPTMYQRLVAANAPGALKSLRLCVSGSAALPADLHAAFERACRQRILERYGMTETVMLVSNPLDGERRPGTVGLPLPGVEVRLSGSPAQIEVRGPNVFGGYWQRPDANAEAFTTDGWFRTGDLGELDEAGYLRITGRAKELIISGGYNVYPREVEDALRAHPAIADAAVVGTPSAEWGEVVTAYVEGPAPPNLAELRTFLADRLAPYKQPRQLHAVDALPRNALGKVQKHRLRDGRIHDER
ncbi:MAG: long-chain fatty acid--CoA ligase [Deltaproteobacteria bacterium]|nr:MAG: long-chain fatty acid--CoA ligase [Deltaproteobacteria bacterium]